jgi:hypothetical protein
VPPPPVTSSGALRAPEWRDPKSIEESRSRIALALAQSTLDLLDVDRRRERDGSAPAKQHQSLDGSGPAAQ